MLHLLTFTRISTVLQVPIRLTILENRVLVVQQVGAILSPTKHHAVSWIPRNIQTYCNITNTTPRWPATNGLSNSNGRWKAKPSTAYSFRLSCRWRCFCSLLALCFVDHHRGFASSFVSKLHWYLHFINIRSRLIYHISHPLLPSEGQVILFHCY